MYLHSVMAKEVLQNRGVSRADAEASERSGSTDSGDTATTTDPGVQASWAVADGITVRGSVPAAIPPDDLYRTDR